MYSGSSDVGLQIKKEDKFFSRLLSKETSMANPSFRVTVAVAVPFIWESQPGTPKHCFSQNTLLPPLTPPPYYFSNSSLQKPSKKHSRSNLIRILFSRINPKKTTTTATTTTTTLSALFSSSSSLSSSNSPSLLPSRKIRERRRFSSCGSSFDSRVYEYDQDAEVFGSPTSTLCFGATRGSKGCYSWW